jgi:hypothetical protein
MICTTLLLAAAIGGMPAGTCVLQCELRNAWVGITSSDGREGPSETSTDGSTCKTSAMADGFGSRSSSCTRRSKASGSCCAVPTGILLIVVALWFGSR